MAGDVTSSLTHSGASGLHFINADYTLTLSRLPEGEYIGLAALTHYSHAGVATGTATMFDRLGPIGSGVATAWSNPGFRPPQPRLARLQDEHRDLPVGPALVGVEVGVGLDQLRPQPLLLLRAGEHGVDQYLVGKLQPNTTFPSLQVGVHVRDTEVRARISYAGADMPIPPREDPKDVFAALFGDDDRRRAMTDPAMARLWAQRKSVFDANNGETDADQGRSSASRTATSWTRTWRRCATSRSGWSA